MAISNKFNKTLSKQDFFTADKVVTLNQWTLIGEYTVPAQQEIAVGATEIINGGKTGRAAYIRFDDTGASQATMNIKVVVADANDQGQIIIEHSSAEWAASSTPDRTKSLLIQEDSRLAVEDSKIQIWAYLIKDGFGNKPTTTSIDESDADTAITLPITVYTVRR